MPETTRHSSGNIFEFNVGGEIFYFSKDTLERMHNRGSVFEKIMHGVHVKKIPFLDVDPALFRKFCAPYLRHELLPISCDFTSVTEQKHLSAAASGLGLVALQNFIEHEMTNRAFYVKIKLLLKSQSILVTRSILMQSNDTIATFQSRLNALIAESRDPELREISDNQEYSFGGFILSTDKTLEYYGIGPSSEIELV